MSQENVEVVRQIYEAVDRRDDATPFEAYAEDIVWDISQTRWGGLMMKPVYRGHEDVREFWRELVAVFGEVDFEIEALMDAGDHVLAVIHDRRIGRASGVPVEAGHVAVWTLSGGKVVRLRVFDDRQAAERAAGLSN